MGIAAVKIRVLPTSPETDLEELEKTMKSLIEKLGGKNCSFQEEEIAFGLKAVIALFAWPEELELENLEGTLGRIEEVSSLQVVDMRRALG
jgi:translation elongation factor aEF-1 beta